MQEYCPPHEQFNMGSYNQTGYLIFFREERGRRTSVAAQGHGETNIEHSLILDREYRQVAPAGMER